MLPMCQSFGTEMLVTKASVALGPWKLKKILWMLFGAFSYISWHLEVELKHRSFEGIYPHT